MCEGWGILTPGALEPHEEETTGEAGVPPGGWCTSGASPGETKLETGTRIATPRELPATISTELSTKGTEQGT